MIIDGVKEVDEYVFELTREAAEELAMDLQRAVEESEDHKTKFPVHVYYEQGNK